MILHKTIVASCNKALSFIFFYKIASELLFIEYFNNFGSETDIKPILHVKSYSTL